MNIINPYRFATAGAFDYYSTYFDGTNDFLSRASTMTGSSDSGTGLISFWCKMDPSSSDASNYYLMRGLSDRLVIYRNTSQRILCSFKNSSGTVVLGFYSTTGQVTAANGWHHVIISFDLGTASRWAIYIDGVDRSDTATTFTVGETVNWSASTLNLFCNNTANRFYGYITEFYTTNPASWFDLSVGSNLLKFRTAGGKPENLGANGSTPTSVQPLIYLHNDYTAFETNLGSGGNFTVTGALSDGGADKP